MKKVVFISVLLITLTLVSGLQCDKEYISPPPIEQYFREKVGLAPLQKAYNINDTIWLSYIVPEKSLYDTVTNQRLPANGVKFPFGIVLLPTYKTPANVVDGFCDFVVDNRLNATFDKSEYASIVRFDIGCDGLPGYDIRVGIVLKYSGIYLLEVPSTVIELDSCANQIKPYPNSLLRFSYDVLDCNKDVYLSIPPADRIEQPEGYTERTIDLKLAYVIKVL